jgi:hypothetical protein
MQQVYSEYERTVTEIWGSHGGQYVDVFFYNALSACR